MAGEKPLDKLEQKIMTKQAVSETDIDTAINDEIAEVQKAYTKPEDDFKKQDHINKLNAFRAKIKKEKDNLYDAWQKNRLDFFQESKRLWAQADATLRETKDRPKRYNDTLNTWKSRTNPDKGEISDYEDSWFESSNNERNKTRFTLMGYLAANAMQDPSLAEAEFGKAKKAYSKFWGSRLDYEDLEKADGMNLGGYMNELKSRYPDKLSSVTTGYLAGFLRLADTTYPDLAPAYKDYLFAEVQKLVNKNIAPDPGKSNETDKDEDRGKKQMESMEMKALVSPKEWVEKFTGLRDGFKQVQDKANQLKDKLGFEYRDAKVLDLLKRDPKTITLKDLDDIKYFRDRVKAEAFGKVVDKQQATDVKLREVRAKLDKIGAAAGELKKELQDKIDEYLAVTVNPASSVEDLLTAVDSYESIKAAAVLIESRAASLKAAPKPKEDDEEKDDKVDDQGGGGKGPEVKGDNISKNWFKQPEKWIDPIFKTEYVHVAKNVKNLAMRNSSGEVVGYIPGQARLKIVDIEGQTKEVEGVRFVKVEYKRKEVWVDQSRLEMVDENERERSEFLKEKNLHEYVDEKHTYSLYTNEVEIVKDEASGMIFKSGNPDVDSRVGGVMARFLNRILSKENLEAYKAKNPENYQKYVSQKKFTLRATEDMLMDITMELGGKDSDKVAEVFRALNEGYQSSVLEYASRPSLKELKRDYDDKIIPAWDRTAAKLEPYAPNIPMTTSETRENKPVSEELNMLLANSPAEMKYIDVLNAVAEYNQHPEKYPSGITIDLPFNNVKTPVVVKFEQGTSGKVKITFVGAPENSYMYNSISEVAQSINVGNLQWIRTYDLMGEKTTYQPYEGLVGKLDNLKKIKPLSLNKEWQIHMEFDWEGALDDPDVWVRPLGHGYIQYAIKWNHVGSEGGNEFRGVAENIDVFMQKMAHHREFGNRYDKIPAAKKRVEASREKNFEFICSPFGFRTYENKMGRIVQSKVEQDYKGSYVLDWGGGNDAGSDRNAVLNVWLGTDGRWNYKISRLGSPGVSETGVAENPEDIAGKVEVLRKRTEF